MKLFVSSLRSTLSSVDGNTPVITYAGDYGALPYPTRELNVIVAGQSNAVSRNSQSDVISKALELPYTGYLKNAQYWNDTNIQLENYKLIMNQYLGDLIGDYGIEYSLAKNLLDSRQIGKFNLFKFAEGGTAIGTAGGYGKWNPTTGVRTADFNAMMPATGYNYDYLIWFQGETDALNTTDGNAYEQNLQDLMDLFRSNSVIDKVIIIRLANIPDFDSQPGSAGVRAGQDALVVNNAWAYMVTPNASQYTFIDNSHYPLNAIRDIGNLCADLIKTQL